MSGPSDVAARRFAPTARLGAGAWAGRGGRADVGGRAGWGAPQVRRVRRRVDVARPLAAARGARPVRRAHQHAKAARRCTRLLGALAWNPVRERAAILHPVAGCLVADGRDDAAAKTLHAGLDAASLAPAERAVWLNNRACAALERDPHGALALVEEALKLRPDVAAIQHTRGQALLATGRTDDAIAVLDAVRSRQRRPPRTRCAAPRGRCAIAATSRARVGAEARSPTPRTIVSAPPCFRDRLDHRAMPDLRPGARRRRARDGVHAVSPLARRQRPRGRCHRRVQGAVGGVPRGRRGIGRAAARRERVLVVRQARGAGQEAARPRRGRAVQRVRVAVLRHPRRRALAAPTAGARQRFGSRLGLTGVRAFIVVCLLGVASVAKAGTPIVTFSGNVGITSAWAARRDPDVADRCHARGLERAVRSGGVRARPAAPLGVLLGPRLRERQGARAGDQTRRDEHASPPRSRRGPGLPRSARRSPITGTLIGSARANLGKPKPCRQGRAVLCCRAHRG